MRTLYTEPIGNDLALNARVEYSSFDKPIEANVFEEPIQYEANFEPVKEREHRTNMRRNWMVSGFKDYSIQTILIMMSSIFEHVLYKKVPCL